MKIPFIVILRNGRLDTIHQTTPSTQTVDFLDFISTNLASEPPQFAPTQADLDHACKERFFQYDTLVVQIVDVDVNTDQPGFVSHGQRRLWENRNVR